MEKSMRSDLATIDTVMDREITTRYENAGVFSEGEKNTAKEKGKTTVAGFEVFDEAAEKAALDAIVASRRKAIDTFIADRTKAREKLSGLGLTALAILPTSAWDLLCDKAKLFRLAPDGQSRVAIDPTKSANEWSHWIVETTTTKKNPFYGTKFEAKSFNLKKGSEQEINAWAYANWAEFLHGIFGGFAATPVVHANLAATIMLPTPPADVAQTLLKARSLGLKVAAVPEAISLKETPASVMRRIANKLEADARWKEARDADPIVYFEEGTAAAIIAQFGDFPIEQELVDAVVKSDDLIKDVPDQMSYLTYGAPSFNEAYYNEIQRQQALLLQQSQQYIQYPNTILGGQSQNYLGYAPSQTYIGNSGTGTGTWSSTG